MNQSESKETKSLNTMDSNKLTDVGFKRIINKRCKLIGNMKRAFVKCKKCKNKAFYDYIPYSLSNPIRTTPCFHKFEDYKKF